MSKYIIELDYDLQRVVGVGVKQGTAWFKDYDVDDLEELCDDYINENFGDLQDTAYQKGFEDGKAQVERGCDGCKYEHRSQGESPCYSCSKNYMNMWTAKDDKIEVGDEVNWDGDSFIVTRIFHAITGTEECDGVDMDGCTYHDVLMDDLEKTGRHFDIASILEEMRHD